MEDELKEFNFIVTMTQKEEKIELACDDCEEKQYEIKKNRAVALIGNQFYQGAFLPATELEKAHKGWENTLHDINHQGTTDARGLTVTSNILYFVGYNDNVAYNSETNKMSMDIHISDNTHYATAWKGYVELCENSGQTPNVSVAFLAKTKSMKVSDLPSDVDYKAYGYSEGDTIVCIYDIQPRALSTVFKGACDDKRGCGIGLAEEESKQDEEEAKAKAEIIKWLKEN